MVLQFPLARAAAIPTPTERKQAATNMSDSDAMSFSDSQSRSATEDEEEEEVLRPYARGAKTAVRRGKVPLAKKPSLQKRKKPTQIQRKGKGVDPFDDSEIFKPSETMDEEMNAMKQVFLRMSEKKVKQKEERKAECKRLYKEAFHTDVEQLFRKAAKSRAKAMDKVSSAIEDVKTQLQASSEALQDAHTAYQKSFAVELTQAAAEIEQLRTILSDLDVQYTTAQKSIQVEFAEVSETMEFSMQQLELKLLEAYDDKAFFSSFRPQIERLL